MRRSRASIIVGVFLVLMGLLLLLENLGVLVGGWQLVLALLFAAGGLGFLWVFFGNRAEWWPVIPGMVLLGLAGVIGLETLAPEASGGWTGGLFLGWIALAFIVVYLNRRENWWAIIPGGVITTVAVTAVLSETLGEAAVGGIFFLGLGLTFALLYLVPTPEGRMRWALVPAGVLAVMGALVLAAATDVLGYIWPLALLAAGGYILFRTLTGQRAS